MDCAKWTEMSTRDVECGQKCHLDLHIDHYVREAVENGHIMLKYCPTGDMLADLFTRSLAKVRFERFRSAIRVLVTAQHAN